MMNYPHNPSGQVGDYSKSLFTKDVRSVVPAASILLGMTRPMSYRYADSVTYYAEVAAHYPALSWPKPSPPLSS